VELASLAARFEKVAEPQLVLKEFGRLATIVDIPRPQSLLEHWGKNSTIYFIFTQQNRVKLDHLRRLIERERIRPVVDSQMPLSEVARAHERIEERGVRGKIVLDPAG
jgi:NADPH:quinone reductase